MTAPRKPIHLAAHFPGVNNTTVWSDPASGSQTDFASFVHLARVENGEHVRVGKRRDRACFAKQACTRG